MKKLKYIGDNIIFSKAFTFITKFNSGYNNPYHNNNHLINVFNNCIEICSYHGLDNNECEICGLAALFHDFNHNGKVGQDDINIPIAIDAFKIFWETLKNNVTNEIYQEYLIRVPHLIKMTNFPDRPKSITLIERIIQDADMLTMYNDDWKDSVIIGLAQEFKIPLKEHINNQFTFIENLDFCTVYAKNKHNDNKEKLINELIKIKRII